MKWCKRHMNIVNSKRHLLTQRSRSPSECQSGDTRAWKRKRKKKVSISPIKISKVTREVTKCSSRHQCREVHVPLEFFPFWRRQKKDLNHETSTTGPAGCSSDSAQSFNNVLFHIFFPRTRNSEHIFAHWSKADVQREKDHLAGLGHITRAWLVFSLLIAHKSPQKCKIFLIFLVINSCDMSSPTHVALIPNRKPSSQKRLIWASRQMTKMSSKQELVYSLCLRMVCHRSGIFLSKIGVLATYCEFTIKFPDRNQLVFENWPGQKLLHRLFSCC